MTNDLKHTTMKKLLFLILTCCLVQVSIVKAADTDVSGIANVVYIPHFEVQPGATNFLMSINMKNTAAIRGFQFDLELPEGITATMSGTGVSCTLYNSRCPKDDFDEKYHTLNGSLQTDGSYRFLAGSTENQTFKGNDGTIVLVRINVDSGMATGDYTIRLKDIKLSETDIDNHYDTELVESTVTVSNNPRTILNETSTTAPAAAASANIRVNRTIIGGEWNTICLPFDMTAEQVTGAFGNDVELADFTGYDVTKDGDNVTDITVNFEAVTAIAKNHPYIIKVTNTVLSFTADGVAVEVGTPTVSPKDGKSFIGTYVAETTIPNNNLFLSGNNFWYSAGTTKMKAFRAYFNFEDVLAEVINSSRIMMSFNEATGIKDVKVISSGKTYNLSGQQVEKPSKGLYIQDGKKVIIK